jgi:predicted NodU family carbamoyl transferase
MIITDKEEAINKILQQQIVAIFQDSSEYGPRALGNRSLLFDPRTKTEKISLIK